MLFLERNCVSHTCWNSLKKKTSKHVAQDGQCDVSCFSKELISVLLWRALKELSGQGMREKVLPWAILTVEGRYLYIFNRTYDGIYADIVTNYVKLCTGDDKTIS